MSRGRIPRIRVSDNGWEAVCVRRALEFLDHRTNFCRSQSHF